MSLTVTTGPLDIQKLMVIKNSLAGTGTIIITYKDASGTIPMLFDVQADYELDTDFALTDGVWTTALNSGLSSLGYTL